MFNLFIFLHPENKQSKTQEAVSRSWRSKEVPHGPLPPPTPAPPLFYSPFSLSFLIWASTDEEELLVKNRNSDLIDRGFHTVLSSSPSSPCAALDCSAYQQLERLKNFQGRWTWTWVFEQLSNFRNFFFTLFYSYKTSQNFLSKRSHLDHPSANPGRTAF